MTHSSKLDIWDVIVMFRDGTLSKADGDEVAFNEGICTLWTEKPFEWTLTYDEVAWELLCKQKVNCVAV